MDADESPNPPVSTENGPAGARPQPRWEEVAERLEAHASQPTVQQHRLAAKLDMDLPEDVPAHVAAVLLRHSLRHELFQSPGPRKEIPEALEVLEDELGITTPATLRVGTRDEISAWFAARYAEKASRALRQIQVDPGDVVEVARGLVKEIRVISSIGWNGRLYMKGRPPIGAWPGSVQPLARQGEPDFDEALQAAHAGTVNSADYSRASFRNFDAIRQHRIGGLVPTPEAIRALEELLESGETREEAFQQLLTAHPQLIASCAVIGGRVHVIAKQRLGIKYVTDFLVLTVNSLGPRWVAVEIESPRHEILRQDQKLRDATRHAVDQIKDWREWLTQNAPYAQTEHGLFGINNRIEGLVIIGRSEPTPNRDAFRSQEAEDSRIRIQSWDYVLRNAKTSVRNPLHATLFAQGAAFDDRNKDEWFDTVGTLVSGPGSVTLDELAADDWSIDDDL